MAEGLEVRTAEAAAHPRAFDLLQQRVVCEPPRHCCREHVDAVDGSTDSFGSVILELAQNAVIVPIERANQVEVDGEGETVQLLNVIQFDTVCGPRARVHLLVRKRVLRLVRDDVLFVSEDKLFERRLDLRLLRHRLDSECTAYFEYFDFG